MNVGEKLIKYIFDEKFRFSINSSYGLHKNMDDNTYLNKFYKNNGGTKLDLVKPKSFNEKLNWIKLNDRKESYTNLADKYEVKEFVSSIIGEQYIVKNYGVYNSVDEINFNNLPNKFVIKATHDSSGALMCRDKNSFDISSFKKKYKKILKKSFYNLCREWPYKNIKPRIIVDEYLEDNYSGDNHPLLDYKFWCFNGEPKYMYCTVKKDDIYENFYDMDFNPVDINHGFPRNSPEFEKPEKFDEMIELARKLATASKTFFVRVDFFYVNNHVYFGEFTFFDWAGLRPFKNEDQDMELGKLIRLPVDEQ